MSKVKVSLFRIGSSPKSRTSRGRNRSNDGCNAQQVHWGKLSDDLSRNHTVDGYKQCKTHLHTKQEQKYTVPSIDFHENYRRSPLKWALIMPRAPEITRNTARTHDSRTAKNLKNYKTSKFREHRRSWQKLTQMAKKTEIRVEFSQKWTQNLHFSPLQKCGRVSTNSRRKIFSSNYFRTLCRTQRRTRTRRTLSP